MPLITVLAPALAAVSAPAPVEAEGAGGPELGFGLGFTAPGGVGGLDFDGGFAAGSDDGGGADDG